MGKAQVLCTSEGFIESNERSTTFCWYVHLWLIMNSPSHCIWHSLTGILQNCGIFQGMLLVAFHALGLCWSYIISISLQKVQSGGRIKYIHVITVVLALVVPAISPLLHQDLIDGYHISPSPLKTCFGGSVLITTTTLPINILMTTTTSGLVIFLSRRF